MKGVQLVGHGGPDRLVWKDDLPVPVPGTGEALVRVLAAGVNNTDINTRIGWYSREVTGGTGEVAPDPAIKAGGWAGAIHFPRIQGGDLCGQIVEVGDGVTRLRPGMRVICPINLPEPTEGSPFRFRSLGSELDGAFAQYCVVPARHLHDVSAAPLSDVELGAIPCAHGTAFNLLSRAAVTEGETVLVTGASGGVGLAAVELAKLRGAQVVAMASPGKMDAVRAAGADAVLERGKAARRESVDAVIDVVGGPGFASLVEALRPGGRLAVSGAVAGAMVEMDLRSVYLKDITLLGCTFAPQHVFAELVRLINAGRVRPMVSRTYPLSAIVEAQEDLLARRYPGKLVLIPPSAAGNGI